MKKHRKKLALLGGIGLTILILMPLWGIKGVSEWYDEHDIQFNQVVNLKLQRPMTVIERQYPTAELARLLEEVPAPEDLETEGEIAIYKVFGLEDYRFAIAVARAESGIERGRVSETNEDGTIDYGEFQINQTHWDPRSPGYKEICDMSLISTTEGNVECAYALYQASGWNPWVVYTKGIVQ